MAHGQFVTATDAIARRVVKENGNSTDYLDYFGKTSPRQFGPEARLITYPSARISTAHWHPVDQFQIFFGAPGAMYQHHPMPRTLVHYTDAYSTYGPFSTGDEPFSFYTLRPVPNDFTGRMPGDRDKLKWRGRRQHHVELDALLSDDSISAGDTVTHTLLEDSGDELGVRLIAAGPESDAQLEPFGGSGSFVCILDGEIQIDDKVYGSRSLGWLSPPDQLRFTTGLTTAHVVVMTFPAPLTTERAS